MSELLAFVLGHPQFRKPRLPSLYSDFRYLQTTNPNGFVANVSAWKSLLADATRKGLVGDGANKLVLTVGEDLVLQLSTQDWGRPLALGVVIYECMQAKELYSVPTFLSQRESIYYWSYAGTMMNWGLQKVGLRATPETQIHTSSKIVSGKFVVIKNVENMAKDVLEKIKQKPSKVGRIYTTDLFVEELAPSISHIDLKILFVFLARDMGEAAYNGKTIKFKSGDEQLSPVNEQDTTIAQLRSLINVIQRRVDMLNSDVSTCTTKAQAAVVSKNRIMATAALKSRRVAESALETQIKSLGQVQDVMAHIEQATDNLELVAQLEKSSIVLNQLNKDIGGTERVDRIMSGLQESMTEVDELNQVLKENGTIVDEKEVDKDLEDLFMEEDAKVKKEWEEAKVQAERLADEEVLSKTLENLQIERLKTTQATPKGLSSKLDEHKVTPLPAE